MDIFLLEDDDAIAMGLTYSLEPEGYEVTRVSTVKEAMLLMADRTFSLYILDLTLPDGSGYDVCRKIKEKGDFPVIILTVMEEEVNVVMGLELGADDYITKPFRVRELLARMKSVLRRYTKETADGVLRYKQLCIYTNEGRVEKNGKEIELTAMEYRLLLILMNHKGMILSRNQLLENIWDVEGDFVNDNTLTVYIKRLRGKIETDPAEPEYIQIRVYADLELVAWYRDTEQVLKGKIRRYFEEFCSDFGSPVLYSGLYGFLDGLQGIRRIRSLTIDAAGQGILRNVNGDVFLPSAGLAVLEQIQLSVSYTG